MPEETIEPNPEKSTALEKTEQYLQKVEIISAKTGQSILEVQGTYDQTMLEVLDVSDVKIVQQVTDLADCAKNIPAALANIAIKKGLEYLSSIPITGTALGDLLQLLALAQKIWEQYQILLQLIEMLKNPETLIMMLANAKLLQGQSLLDKIDDIKARFPGIPGLDGVLSDLNGFDLCNAEFDLQTALGFGAITKMPMNEIPKAVQRLGSVVVDNLQRAPKGEYNALLFKIREGTVKDDSYLEKLRTSGDRNSINQYNEMLTLVNVLAYSYHDDIKKTSDVNQTANLRAKYQQNVATELNKNINNWNSEIVDDFKRRTSIVDTCITSDADSITAFYNPTPSGETLKYSTTGNQEYGGLSKAAFDLILYYEVGSESDYNSKYSKPNWPGGQSGVTIGVGYDIGYQSKEQIEADWSGIIPNSDISRITAAAGAKGNNARNAVLDVNDISISWEAAKAIFVKKTLPKYKAECIRAFPSSDKLHPDAFGALVSLVFNRGPSTIGKDREEMGRIRAALLGQTKGIDIYDYIADQLISMKRIWANTGLTSLLTRREHEAKLVRSGKSGG